MKQVTNMVYDIPTFLGCDQTN